MKKFILTLMIFANFAYGLDEDIVVNEFKSDLYYGNGIMTTKKEAWTSLKKTLKPAIIHEIYNGDEDKMYRELNFDVSYNWSAKEDFGDTSIALALDLMEANEQLSNTSWGWWSANKLVSWATGPAKLISNFGGKVISKSLRSFGFSKWAANMLADKIAEEGLESVENVAKATVDYDADEMHDKDLDEMVNNYKESIKSGHSIILVTHSQGNLFAVEAAERIVGTTELPIGDNKPWMKKYIYHVSIASPATSLARSHHAWAISLDNDIVANIPGAIGSQLSYPNYSRYFTHKATITPVTNTYTYMKWMEYPPINKKSPNGYWLRGNKPIDYTVVQSYDDDTLGIRQNYRFDVKADEWEYQQVNFHAFDYYMGKTVYKLYVSPYRTWTPPLDPRTNEYKSKTHEMIIHGISEALKEHKNQSSQWKAKNIGKICEEKYAEMTHLYDDEMNSILNGFKVMDFSEGRKGKVQAHHRRYIRASSFGARIEEANNNNTCYVLKDSNGNIIGKITGQTTDSSDDGNVDNTSGGDSNDNNSSTDNGDNSDDNSTTGGDDSNGDDNNTTDDPTQDPNKVCVSNYFKYYEDGKIHDSLKKGDKDAELYSDGTKHQVKEMQEFLQAFGYDVGSSGADGWFGSDTKDALIAFQDANGLDADGIVGPNTRDAMNSQNCYDK